MFSRRSASVGLGVVMLGILAVTSLHATHAARTMHVSFSGPVSLPGVTLGTGTYIFELADPTNRLDVVTVLDRSRSTVYYTGFTHPIARPAGAVQPVSLGERSPGGAPKIIAWYPDGDSVGHAFAYPKNAR